MVDDWKEQMQERFDKLDTKVDNLGTKVDKLETKVDILETKVDKLETKVDKLESKFDNLETKFDAVEERLSNNFKIAVEEIKDTVNKVAEGCNAGFAMIRREMNDMNGNWDTKWAVHDRALRNHSSRLSKLEGRKP